ncbi:hypothetical protein KJ937_05270, partial [Patescibacteria group bacterium]|nr:hypothetical protein [Patescibacteria group bacterium]
MKFKRYFSIVAVLAIFSVVSGQGCLSGPTQDAVQASKRVTLNVWAVVDDVDVYHDIFQDYRVMHP